MQRYTGRIFQEKKANLHEYLLNFQLNAIEKTGDELIMAYNKRQDNCDHLIAMIKVCIGYGIIKNYRYYHMSYIFIPLILRMLK